jgi:MFS family permease
MSAAAHPRALASNLWKVFAYAFLNEFWLLAPALIPYYQSRGLDAARCLGVQAVYAVGVILFEVPSGYLADRFGRRRALLWASGLIVAGLTSYALGASFLAFALSELLLAAGNSLRSGTDAAMIHDTLAELDRAAEYTSWQARSEMWMRLGMASASVLGGLLAARSLKLPFWVNIGTGAGMLVLALLLVEPERRRMETGPWRGITDVVSDFARSAALLRIAIFGALLAAGGVIGVWSYVLYYQACHLSVGLFGALMAAFGVASSLGARLSAPLAARIGPRAIFWAGALVIPLGFAALGSARSVWLIAISCVNGFVWNLSGPLLLSAVNDRFSSDRRATAISVFRLAGSLLYAAGAPLFGRLVDSRSLSTAYLVLAAVLAAASILVVPRAADLRR